MFKKKSINKIYYLLLFIFYSFSCFSMTKQDISRQDISKLNVQKLKQAIETANFSEAEKVIYDYGHTMSDQDLEDMIQSIKQALKFGLEENSNYAYWTPLFEKGIVVAMYIELLQYCFCGEGENLGQLCDLQGRSKKQQLALITTFFSYLLCGSLIKTYVKNYLYSSEKIHKFLENVLDEKSLAIAPRKSVFSHDISDMWNK